MFPSIMSPTAEMVTAPEPAAAGPADLSPPAARWLAGPEPGVAPSAGPRSPAG